VGAGGALVCTRAAVRARPGAAGATARMYDWKKRGSEEYTGVVADGELMQQHTVRPAPGSTHRKKRVGRGVAAGQGRSAGRGMRGQKSRSGPNVRIGFEGGQTPLYRQMPKYVGRPMGPGHTKTEYGLIKFAALNKMDDGAEVDYAALLEAAAMTKVKQDLVKVIGGGEDLTAKNLTVRAHAFTTSAVDAIQGNGGRCILISPTTGEDFDMGDEDEDEEEDEDLDEEDEEETSE